VLKANLRKRCISSESRKGFFVFTGNQNSRQVAEVIENEEFRIEKPEGFAQAMENFQRDFHCFSDPSNLKKPFSIFHFSFSIVMNFDTKVIHAVPVDPLTGAISVPIYQTSTFVQEAPGVNQGFDYGRTGNPTRKVLENLIAELEGGHSGFAFGSGLAAIDAVIKLLNAGDEVLAVDDIYGGTYRIFSGIYSRLGIDIQYVDTTSVENVTDAISSKTKFVWLETPTNPTLKVSDIAEIAKIAHANGALLVVDNTFASPALQRPLELGADIVVHSATKYLAGHSDVVAGLVVAKDPEIAARIKYIQNASGAILGPFDSWLCIRGIETLNLRIERQSQNAQAIAEFLQGHPAVAKVHYPGLESHHNHLVAKQQQRLFGGVLSLSFHDDRLETAREFVCQTKLFKLAESLGGVKSLLCHPATMTHASVPAAKRQAAGVNDSLVRLSCGIEHVDDLMQDIALALQSLSERSSLPIAERGEESSRLVGTSPQPVSVLSVG
jgi:cystathionine beta-lyase